MSCRIFLKEHMCKSLRARALTGSQQCLSFGLVYSAGLCCCCFSFGPVEPGRLRCYAVLNIGKPRPWHCGDKCAGGGPPGVTAVMNGSKLFVYFSRFMGLVPFPVPEVFAYVYKKGQVQDFVCLCVCVFGHDAAPSLGTCCSIAFFLLTGLAKSCAGERENKCFW